MKRDLLILALLSLAILPLLNHYVTGKQKPAPPPKTAPETPKAQTINRVYGIPVDSFHIVTSVIRRNEFLSTIFERIELNRQKVQEVIEASEGVFDIRKIRSGRPYKVFYAQNDTTHRIRHFVYEKSPIEYVRIDFTDSVRVTKGKKEVTTKTKTAAAKIDKSLWMALKEGGYNVQLSGELSRIFAWTIDFFGLQKGDAFKVIYKEEYVDTNVVGISGIEAAYFKHIDTTFYAFAFEDDSTTGYYDLNGNSLEKEFLKAPLSYSRVSSGFSYSRLHPIYKVRRPHLGVDYAAPRGTPVHSIGDGVVVSKYYSRGGGNVVKIKHNSVYTSAYLHLSGYASGLHTGKTVTQGETIGYVGSTGASTGPHLDFRVWRNGHNIDPTEMESPPVAPVSDENRGEYLEKAFRLKKKLEQIRISHKHLIARK